MFPFASARWQNFCLSGRWLSLSDKTSSAKNRTIMSILRPQIEFRLFMVAKGFTSLVVAAGILLLLPSCGSDDRNADQPILSHHEMVKALTEIYLAEQKVNRLGVPRDSAEREFERFKMVIFKKVGTSDSVFKRSFDYYMDHPREMEQIYSTLVDSLSLMEQRYDLPVK